MATSKTAKVEAEIGKVKGKIAEFQAKLKELEQKKMDIENAEIVGMVRGMDMVDLGELAKFLTAYREQRQDSPPAVPGVAESAAEPEAAEPEAVEDAAQPEAADIVAGGFQYNGDTGGGNTWK